MVRQKDVKVELGALYKSYFGNRPVRVCELPGAGSGRQYFRLFGATGTAVGVYGDDVAENHAFMSLSKVFWDEGLPVPHIYGMSRDGHTYLQEDLGDAQLMSFIGSLEGLSLVEKCMRRLPQLQTVPREKWMSCTFNNPFGRRQVMWDLNYFKYEYLKVSGVTFDESLLEDDFERMADSLTDIPDILKGFMYRDCQSRNVMIKADEPYWIDYQGGRLGPCIYDAVSMLWQAKAGFSEEFRRHMLAVYASEFGRLRGIEPGSVLLNVDKFVLFRTLQVLGAYGLRGLVERKAHFIESIPGALANLDRLVSKGVLDSYPELKRVCARLVNDPRFSPAPTDGKLRIEVFSFSYKRGYPTDFSGNGGGFMFDCRGLHNPGRYDIYKPLTGLDSPVREFLEKKGEVQTFLESSWQVVDQTVECYLRRGFTSLQIGFGCTGGRHRSVYSADRTAHHIASRFPDAIVTVNHREQGIREEVKE